MSVIDSQIMPVSDLEASRQDHYVTHLVEVNKSNEVISTEDIVNSKGVLVVRKGSRIDADAAQRVMRHKLLRPLEEQVQIKDCMDGPRIHQHLRDLLEKYPDLKQVHAALRFDAECEYLMQERKLHPVLIQKVTVQYQQQPDMFQKSLFCAWLSALVGREMRFDKEAIHAVFMAGLMHDVGFLHISPEVIHKTGTLTAPEWRAIQSHVVVGHIVLEKTAGIPARVARAVLEHHELCDGTGYPVGKHDTQLDILGQIVGLADSLQAIRVNQFERCGRNLRDALPYLQLNSTTHFYTVYQAISSILKKSGLKPTVHNAFGSISALANHLLNRAASLRDIVAELAGLLELLPTFENKSRGKSLCKVVNSVLTMITSSGLAREELASWLNSLQDLPDETAMPELNEIELMQNEFYWQIKKMRHVFAEFLEKDCKPDSEHGRLLTTIAAGIDACLATRT